MKRILLLSLLLFFVQNTSVFAQFQYGDLYLEGNFRIIKTTQDRIYSLFNSSSQQIETQKVETQILSINIVPTVNIFISDDISLYVGLGYERFKFEEIRFRNSRFETPKVVDEAFVTIVGIRNYKSISSRVHFYNSFRSFSSFGRTKTEDGALTPESDNFVESISIRHGLVFEASDKFLLSASFGSLFVTYTKNDLNNADLDTDIWSYGINTNLGSLSISVSYKF